MPLYTSDGSWWLLFFLWKIFTLCSYCWLLKISFDEVSRKQVDLEQIQIFLFSIKKVRCENLYSQNFFMN